MCVLFLRAQKTFDTITGMLPIGYLNVKSGKLAIKAIEREAVMNTDYRVRNKKTALLGSGLN